MSRVLTRSAHQPDQKLEAEVLNATRRLSFPAFERGVQILLRSMCLREVVIVGRRSWRGRSRFGGIDLRASSLMGAQRVLALIQVKQYGVVQRRFVDELRGAMLRSGAPQGWIISTHQFSKPAVIAAEAYPARPVRLIDGPELGRLMVKNGVGVRTKPLSFEQLPELVVDRLFFEDLEDLEKR